MLSGLLLSVLFGATFAQAQSLKGSATSIERQYQAARSYGLAFVDSASAVRRYVGPGQLVRVNPSRYLKLHDVSYPYAVPATKVFLNRLSSQYYSACGEKLTVTSLLRPRDRQPANSVAKSVHPTGMAIDLRVPRSSKCRSWLERVLLSLERDRVLDVTRERRPPHYHVALFVEKYERRLGIQSAPATGLASAPGGSYTVHRGDTLSEIASLTGVSVSQLRAINGLKGNRIYSGQKLRLGAGSDIASAASTAANVATSAATKASKASIVAATVSPTVTPRTAPVKSFSDSYTVRRGDSLSEIAAATGVSTSQLRAVNGLRGSRIYAGQKLQLPSTAATAVAGSTGSTREYTVQRGDSLSEIAAAAGVSTSRMRAANGLNGNRIYAGQKLQIPGSGALAASGGLTHKVSRGDTLWRIANLYGTSVAQLKRANAGAGDSLRIGQLLRITSG